MYGGTKTEMERLLKDAEAIKAKNGEMVDYSIDSFADMVEAIHVVQKEMYISGITQEEADRMVAEGLMSQEDAYKLLGTTAKEAATTVSGAQGMMQAAWENLIAGFGREDVDLSGLIDNLLASVQTYIENLVPVVKRIFDGVWKTVFHTDKTIEETMAPFIEKFQTLIEQDVAPALERLGGALEGFWKDVGEPLVEFLGGVFSDAWEDLEELWRTTLSPILGLVIDDFTWLLDNVLTPVGDFIVDTFVAAWDSLDDAWDKDVIPALETLTGGLQDFNDNVLVPLASYLVDTFLVAWQDLSNYWKTNLKPALKTLGDKFDEWWTSTGSPLATNLKDNLLQGFKDIYNYWKTYIIPKIKELAGKFDSFLEYSIKPLAGYIKDDLLQKFKDLKNYWNDTLKPALKTLGDNFSSFMTEIVAPLVEKLSDGLLVILKDLKDFWVDTLIPKLGDLKTAFEGFIGKILDTNADIGDLGDKFKWFWDNILSPFTTFVTETVVVAINGIEAALTGIIDFMTRVFSGDWEGAWQVIVDGFGTVFGTLGDIAKTPINKVIEFINWMIGGVENALNWIVDKINSTLSIHLDPITVLGATVWDGLDWSANLNRVEFGRIDKLLAGGGTLSEGQSAIVGEYEPERIQVVNGQAVVTPLHTDRFPGGDNVNIYVYPQPEQSPEEIAREVQRQFVTWERQRRAAYV